MALTFKLYTDSALTSEFSGTLQTTHNTTGSTGRVDSVLYLGSVAASKTLEADSDPGVDQITLTVADTTPASGHEVAEVKLALSQAGLDGATGGAALNLGLSVLSGVPGALPVWIGIEAAYLTVGVSTELSIDTNVLRES